MIVLAFHTSDHSDAHAIAAEAAAVARHARVVSRNGDLFSGYIERAVGRDSVVAIHAPHHPHIVRAYEAAGISALEITPTEPSPADDAPVVVTDDEPEAAPSPTPAAPKKAKR